MFTAVRSSPIFYNPNLINCTRGLFGWWLTSCSVNPVDLLIVDNDTGGGTVDYTNIAYQNQTNNFTQNSYMSNLNISGILYIGNNRSAFPITCSGNQFLSSLGSNGIFVCTVPVIYNASYLTSDIDTTDYTNVAFLNNSQNWTASQNFTLSVWVGKNFNVTGNSSFGNVSVEYLNVSGQLFVGANRSSFPITCSAGQFVSALGASGLFTCSTPATGSTDYTNVAFLNNTHNFTAVNTFREIYVMGWLNDTNATVWTVLNNVSSKGYINASGFNATGSSIFGNINISGRINSTGTISGGIIEQNGNGTIDNSTGMKLLCSNTTTALGSAVISIDCLSLPKYVVYLVSIGFPQMQSNGQPSIRFNNDAGNDYSYSACISTSTTCTTSTSASSVIIKTSSAKVGGVATCWIYNFAGDRNTTASCIYTDNIGAISTAPSEFQVGGFWNQNAQISEISLLSGVGAQFLVNTTLKVYGVV